MTEIGGGHIFDVFQYYVKSDLDFGKVTRDDSLVTLMSMPCWIFPKKNIFEFNRHLEKTVGNNILQLSVHWSELWCHVIILINSGLAQAFSSGELIINETPCNKISPPVSPQLVCDDVMCCGQSLSRPRVTRHTPSCHRVTFLILHAGSWLPLPQT